MHERVGCQIYHLHSIVVHLFAFVCVLPHFDRQEKNTTLSGLLMSLLLPEKFLFLNHLRKVQLGCTFLTEKCNYTFYEKKTTDAYLEFLTRLLLSKSVKNKCRQFLLTRYEIYIKSLILIFDRREY
jgi:hypothetical protein